MGHQSIVSGYIEVWQSPHTPRNTVALADYPYDDVWPFTNIFWEGSPARYDGSLIGFAGSYKQVEEVWAEWLWKFSRLLSRLEATRAKVHLSCVMGEHSWVLEPESRLKTPTVWPETFVGETWLITRAPADDFSIDPDWNAWVGQKFGDYRWDKFVSRQIRERG